MLVRLSCARSVRRDRDTKNQREEFAVLHKETECAVHPTPQVVHPEPDSRERELTRDTVAELLTQQF